MPLAGPGQRPGLAAFALMIQSGDGHEVSICKRMTGNTDSDKFTFELLREALTLRGGQTSIYAITLSL